MKIHLLYASLATLLCSYTVEAANYTTQTGSLSIPDVSIDGKLSYKNVTLQLDMNKGGFVVVNSQAIDPVLTPQESFEAEGYTINLLNCARVVATPKNVVCNVTINNNQTDRLLYLFSSTTAYDVESNAYNLLASTLANKSSGTYDKGVSAQLIQGTTAKMTVTFVLPETLTRLSALTLDFSKNSYTKTFDHTFRNIVIQ